MTVVARSEKKCNKSSGAGREVPDSLVAEPHPASCPAIVLCLEARRFAATERCAALRGFSRTVSYVVAQCACRIIQLVAMSLNCLTTRPRRLAPTLWDSVFHATATYFCVNRTFFFAAEMLMSALSYRPGLPIQLALAWAPP